ncbi:MAG: roadblock/LC7 domain-containing protein [Methanobacteriaceae archaeon]|nr:roadblock/LC7 domain-containing protein [Methanobacteriaceae archaeon]MDZ4170895.1 roadblock/LC7 domain-containing protein [Methanobacteriaceae archaeon]
MKRSNIELKLEKALNKVNNIKGVDGTLVVDNQGGILYSSLSYDNVDLFGSMANIISSSSEKLLDLSKQGLIERILVESVKGKALFLSLERAHLVVLTNKKANIGMIILSSKKSAKIIKEMDEIKEIPEFVESIPSPETAPVIEQEITEAVPELGMESSDIKTKIVEKEEISVASSNPIEEIIIESKTFKAAPKITETKTVEKEVGKRKIADESLLKPKITAKEGKKASAMEIPVIKPPLSFPPLPDIVTVPGDLTKKSELIIDIYEAIMLAMSIGASKIMGTAPARGMLKKSIPYDESPELLDGVDVKSNSSLQFNVIRSNLEKFPLETRQKQTIDGFTKIISSITDKYGKVMGYGAFRGMIRPEFKKIYASYGPAMEELGIKEKIHPELRELMVS